MTKPDDIPQDVWVDAGIELAGRRIPASDTEVADTVAGWAREIASRAILAERERCVKLCDKEVREARAHKLLMQAQGAHWCASAIRKGDQP